MSSKKTVDLVITFLSITKGREKSFRFIQYFSRFIKVILEYVSSKQGNKDLLKIAQNFDKLGANMALTRKVLRFGNEVRLVNSIKSYLNGYNNKSQADNKFDSSKNLFYVISRIFSDASLIGYYICDHYVYFHKIGWTENKELANKLDIWGSKLWFCEVLGTCLAEGYEILNQKQRIAEAVNSYAFNYSKQQNSKDPEAGKAIIADAKKKIDSATYNFIMSFIDVPSTIYFSTSGKVFSPGLCWILSATSSFMGAYTAWPK